MRLERFNHHPDPAIDFELEVGDIEAEAYNLRVGFGEVERGTLQCRIARALDFRVGGVPTAVAAKQRLREISAALRAALGDDR